MKLIFAKKETSSAGEDLCYHIGQKSKTDAQDQNWFRLGPPGTEHEGSVARVKKVSGRKTCQRYKAAKKNGKDKKNIQHRVFAGRQRPNY